MKNAIYSYKNSYGKTALIGSFLSASLMLMSTGCGGGTEAVKGREKTFPVTGVIKLDGEPLAGATVTFHGPAVAKNGKLGMSAVGTTNSSGKYQLTTYEANDGAVPESYVVSITKTEAPPATGTTGEYVPPDAKARVAPPKSLVPVKYTTPAKSGLTATVTESKENLVDLTLTSK